MAGKESLGQFEQLVLTAVVSLGPEPYAVPIRQKVEEMVQSRAVSLGAVYATLDRLEDKGMVSSWLSEPTRERGGRAKRCYQIEGLGERALQESADTARRMVDNLVTAWGDPSDERWKNAWD